MRTDDLIAALGAEPSPVRPVPLGRVVLGALAVGGAVTGALFAAFWGVRMDLSAVLFDPFLLAKTLLPLALGVLAVPVGLASIRPGGVTRAAAGLWLVPVVLVGLVAVALWVTPPALWWTSFVGHSIATCLPSIFLLSVPVSAALLAAFRSGAPEHPARAGAAAGLIAAGVSAAIYSVYCTEDSPLFYAAWYTLAMAAVIGASALAGRHLLRW
ncbi:DUF1109 domain-containing protein [Maribius pontilimi]|uniref:DUF1109 domain-containing protein n=1 Tax=Palleronia pontilimi TaxID=1964209 RepID=A0A934IID6_9RHOB|nr:DUF1109 domain-containing protein [Palleronia pontilimi]MBJ3763602.1 DUF1109 domain-containing protein [Palleronia pontilimi]